MYASLLTTTLYIFVEFYYIYAHCVLNVQVHQLLAMTGSEPLAKPSRTGFDQLSNNHKPEPAKATISASWFAASRTAATLIGREDAKLQEDITANQLACQKSM